MLRLGRVGYWGPKAVSIFIGYVSSSPHFEFAKPVLGMRFAPPTQTGGWTHSREALLRKIEASPQGSIAGYKNAYRDHCQGPVM
jgi:hypothetical protein